MRLIWALATLLFTPFIVNAQARLNLNFEPGANRHQPLLLWITRVSGQTQGAQVLRIDTLTRTASGRGSLLVDASRTEEASTGAIYTSLAPIDSLRGQTVTISASLRTEGFQGRAFLYAHAQSQTAGENLASNDNFNSPTLPVTADWQRLQIQLPVPANATNLLFGLRFQGRGKVWLDDVRVEWGNGQRYHDQLLPSTEPLVLSAAARRANWDFERALPPLPDPRYKAHLDSLTPPHQGRRSLVLEASAGHASPYAYLGQVPVDSSMRGKTLVVQGFIRRAGTAPAPAFTYAFIAEKGQLGNRRGARNLLREIPIPATTGLSTEWQPFSVAIPITWNDYFSQIALGLHLNGAGPVWVDEIRLLVDGKPYAPPTDRDQVALPTAAELAWLRQTAIPLRTVAADGGDTKDLAAFGTLAGKVQIIGLGEVTYGSREIARLRHRLARYAVEQKGVRAIVLESDMAACLALNHYLQTGQGNLRQLLGQLGSYNSSETLALVQWLRAYNERATSKIQVWGLECQRPEEAIAWLRQLLPEQASELRTQLDRAATQLKELPKASIRLNPFTTPTKTDPRLTAIRGTLNDLRLGFDEQARLRATSDLLLPEVATVRQLLLMLEQYATQQTLDLELAPGYRAACLAENIYWCRGQQTGGKMLVLAHNNVVSVASLTAQKLRATYGLDYVALGMAFASGSFRADNGLGTSFSATQAAAAELGSYEYYFQTAKLPTSYLDLRAPSLGPGTQWLYQNLLLRDVGHSSPLTSFLRHDLRREFDAIVFLPASTPLQAMP